MSTATADSGIGCMCGAQLLRGFSFLSARFKTLVIAAKILERNGRYEPL